MSEVSYADRVQRTVRRVLVAARGVEAAGIVARLEAAGVECVAVFDASDAEAPHLDVASWAVPLPASLAGDAAAIDRAAALCGLALDAGADGVVPDADLAHEAGAARVVANLGLAWVGCSPDSLEALADPTDLRGRLAALGVPLAPAGSRNDVEVIVFGDGTTARACADAQVWAGGAVAPAGLAPAARRGAWDLAARVVSAERLAGPVVVELAGVGEKMRVVGLRPGLPSWHALVALGSDGDVALVVAAVRVAAGEELDTPATASGHVVELVVRASSDGVLEALTLPDGADATVGHAEGEAVRGGTVLLTLRAEGPTLGAARVRAHEALRAVAILGVSTDLESVGAAALLPAGAVPAT